MNGTALRNRLPAVVAWWRHRHHRPWHCAFQAVPPRQRLHQRPEHAAGGAARHLAGTQNLCTNILFFLLEFWFGRKYIGLGTFVNGICIGYIVTAFYDPFTPTSATRRRWRCSWRGSSRRCWSRRWALRSTRPPTSASRPTITFPSVCGTTHPARTSGAASSPMRSAPCCAGCWVALWAWHLDLCVLPWALHPVLRSDVLPEGAAIQTEQLRNPAASNHTLRGSFLLLPLSRK